jgi:hypothetical protein
MSSRAFALAVAVAVVAALPFGCGSRSGLTSDGAVPHPNDSGSLSETDAGTDGGDAGGDAGPDARDGGCAGQFPVKAGFACAVSLGGGDPTVCSDQLDLPICSASGDWKCPDGTIDPRGCDCLSPAPLGCYTCRKGVGWVCPDAGTDGGGDVPGEHPSCAGKPQKYCSSIVGVQGGLSICGDSVGVADCVAGQWKCPIGTDDASQCTCFEFHPPGCTVCTANGWACPDGGAVSDARAD